MRVPDSPRISPFRRAGDTADARYPIFRNGADPDTQIVTMASGLFIVNVTRSSATDDANAPPRAVSGVLRMYSKNPKLFPREFQEFVLPPL